MQGMRPFFHRNNGHDSYQERKSWGLDQHSESISECFAVIPSLLVFCGWLDTKNRLKKFPLRLGGPERGKITERRSSSIAEWIQQRKLFRD